MKGKRSLSNTNTHVISVRELTTFMQKTIGLLGKTKPEAIFMKTCIGIHTFGMQFPIDVVILDKNNHVVSYKSALRPNRLFLWRPQFTRVLELPAGTVVKNNIKKNDAVILQI